ncbi:MAG: glycoside hydrolase family 18 protein [Saprospiraceae bacterium]|nr:glycoside hydrolase family 18 protein [Saprospiraceae bacterium]
MISIKSWTVGLFKLLPSAITLLLAANCQLPTANCQLPCREVIGYYPSWKFYDRQQLVNPATIDYSKYTALNYAFFEPKPDGSVKPFDPKTDKLLLQGGPTTPSLVEKAHEHGTKVFISIGGWTLSEHFSPIAAHPEKRRRFAESCAEMVRNYGVDGIDIDWEYPGYRAQGGSLNDRHYFPLLIQEIRDTFNELQLAEGRQLYITAAFGCSPERMADIEWEQVEPLLDFVNMMTYDFYGRDFSVTNHNSPLYPPAKGIEGYNTHSTIHRLLDFGVPAHKICLGVPFYGRAMKTRGPAGLHVGSAQAVDARTFKEDEGSPSFYNILAKQDQFYYHWDSLAQAPFLRSKSTNTFVSFDDERSVASKAQYILDHGLAGAIVWDITGDCVENRLERGVIERTPLADALKDALCFPQAIFVENSGPTTIERLPVLPQRATKLRARSSSAPRVLSQSPIAKQDKKKRKRKKKKRLSESEKYFDGGW